MQLLQDFAGIPIWIKQKVTISDDISQFLQTDEILRRCEGVGRLLLHQPGDSIIMTTENRSNSTGTIIIHTRNALYRILTLETPSNIIFCDRY